jgi:hypothetical protein
MVVMRARGRSYGTPLTTPGETREGLMIGIHESKQDEVGRATYRMERNFEGENSSVEDRTATKITAGNHRTNDHRNLEKRLEAWGR